MEHSGITFPDITRISRLVLTLLAGLSLGLNTALADKLYFVDAHSQVDHELSDLSLITTRVQENGVRKTLLTARGKRSSRDIIDLAESSTGALIASIRTKGGKYKKNKPKYYQKLEKHGNSGRFGAIAEVIMYHAQKGDKADEVDVLPNDERVKAALEVAKQNGWPFVAHIEFAAIHGRKRKKYMKQSVAMLENNRELPIVLIHLGQLRAKEAGEMLGLHPNLYLMTSHVDPFTTQNSSQPWTNMFKGQSIKQDWQALMKQHPDRFVFALDNVWAEHWKYDYPKKVKLWRKALGELPTKVANAVAHGNAERLWNLK